MNNDNKFDLLKIKKMARSLYGPYDTYENIIADLKAATQMSGEDIKSFVTASPIGYHDLYRFYLRFGRLPDAKECAAIYTYGLDIFFEADRINSTQRNNAAYEIGRLRMMGTKATSNVFTKEFKEKARVSAIANKVARSIDAGADPYTVIEQLVSIFDSENTLAYDFRVGHKQIPVGDLISKYFAARKDQDTSAADLIQYINSFIA